MISPDYKERIEVRVWSISAAVGGKEGAAVLSELGQGNVL